MLFLSVLVAHYEKAIGDLKQVRRRAQPARSHQQGTTPVDRHRRIRLTDRRSDLAARHPPLGREAVGIGVDLNAHRVDQVAHVRAALVLFGHSNEPVAGRELRLVHCRKARGTPPRRGKIDAIAEYVVRVGARCRCRRRGGRRAGRLRWRAGGRSRGRRRRWRRGRRQTSRQQERRYRDR